MNGHIRTPLPYRWRGKTYRTWAGLQSGLQAEFAGCKVSFYPEGVRTTLKTGTVLLFTRNTTAQAVIIADKPIAEKLITIMKDKRA